MHYCINENSFSTTETSQKKFNSIKIKQFLKSQNVKF